MSSLTSGSICFGYGGLDLALKEVFPDVELLWAADTDEAASEILEARYPGVPNLGDVKRIDWYEVPCPDILTAGIPCQPHSTAGKQKGLEDDRDLSEQFLEAVCVLRPKLTILENVAGFKKRGLPRVLAGLAEMGFDAVWHSVKASDAKAPHERGRVFLLAYSADIGREWGWEAWKRRFGSEDSNQVAAYTDNRRARQGRESRERVPKWHQSEEGSSVDWGEYEPAVRRWEYFTRPAPDPIEPGRGGKPRLSARFTEWMMGIPEGWVTGLGFNRKQTFKRLGDGVVPQQGALAIRGLLEEVNGTA